jgi:ring-1,2-phenylacetyl-CoA epoxidase subunit PaaD
MVEAEELGRISDIASAVVDPEIRVVTIAELGIFRGVMVDWDGVVHVAITPTYSGCPAMDVIRADIRTALRAAGYPKSEVKITTDGAPWSTDWITDEGRAKLAAAGIAPPSPVRQRRDVPLTLTVRCPQCGSPETEELSRFGSTACKSLWRCRSCLEPFDRVKPL